MLNFKHLSRVAVAALALTAVAVAPAQNESENIILADFGVAPGAGSSFSVSLSNSGSSNIAGFAFTLLYDPSQVSIVGVTDNTGQPSAKIQYTLGAETAVDDSGTTAQRVLTATTVEDIAKAEKLALIKFEKKPGFTPPFKFEVKDRVSEPVIDGLQGSDLQNIPHMFDIKAVNR